MNNFRAAQTAQGVSSASMTPVTCDCENGEVEVDGMVASKRQPTRLLVSIRDAAEAAIAERAGVDWIDLKEPLAGALGRAELEVAQAVASQLRDHPQRSAALGELQHLDDGVTADYATLFPFLKVGLSHCCSAHRCGEMGSWSDRLLTLANQISKQAGHLIPVIYADYPTCAAPHPSQVLDVARQAGSHFLLIDTYTKDGRSLTDWLSIPELTAIRRAAQEFHCGLVLAGSLKFEQIPQLRALKPWALAVRGAVCSRSRTDSICPSKIDRWCKQLRLGECNPGSLPLPSTATDSSR